MGVNNVGGPGTVQMMSLEGLDLESMLMAVQTNRVNLLDQQIKDQMVAVQDRNNRINALNVNMNGMNAALAKVGTSATEPLGGFTTEFRAAAPQVVDAAAMQERAETSGTLTLDEYAKKYEGTTPSPQDATGFIKNLMATLSTPKFADYPQTLGGLGQYLTDAAAKAQGDTLKQEGTTALTTATNAESQANSEITYANDALRAAQLQLTAAKNELISIDGDPLLADAMQAANQRANDAQWTIDHANQDITRGNQALLQATSDKTAAQTKIDGGQKLVDQGNRYVTPNEYTAALNACNSLTRQIKAGQEVLTKADPAAIACANRSQAEAYIKTQQSQIDALGNSQQQDMLRLQSLSNKRNEAFEIMTNFMKKLSDARSSIIQKF